MKKNLYSLLIIFFLSIAFCRLESGEETNDSLARLSALIDPVLEKQKLTSLYKNYWDFLMKEFPETATMIGYPHYNDQWTSRSIAGIQKRHKAFFGFYDLLKRIDRSNLYDEDQLSYDVLEWELKVRIKDTHFFDEYLPINAFDGLQIQIPQTLLFMPTENSHQIEDILTRLRTIPHMLSEAIELLNIALEKKITPSQIVLRDVPSQIANLITEDPKDSPLFLPFTKLSNPISEQEKHIFQQKAIELLTTTIFPALHQFHRYISEIYIPHCTKTISLSNLPNGQEWYRHKVYTHTSTVLSPQAIHRIGLDEVKRIQKEINKILKKVKFDGDFSQFVEHLHANPRFFFENSQDMLEEYKKTLQHISEHLPKLFNKLPKSEVEIAAVPPYSEATQIAAYYFPGSPEWGRPGYFFVNTYNPKTRPNWEMDALTLHEAVPGHHLQISLAQELFNGPDFQKHSYFTAFVEGWALYAEGLGEELGVYQDSYSKFGRLSYEIFRAARLVVDTGLHYFGWTREQAIAYMKNTTGMNEEEVIREVDRYLVIPGQALAYKIGEMKIKELRTLAQTKLGDKFDIRVFHDKVLSYGSALPLNLFEKEIRKWIDSVLMNQK